MVASSIVRRAAFLSLLCSTIAAAAPAAKTDAPEVLFTFDDGPAPATTPKVLDTLDQHHIKAVFFVNGWHFQGTSANADKARALLREEQRRGHAIGNHTIHHYFLCGHVYVKQAWQEIEGNAKLIEDAIGMRPDLFRTPYGAHCRALNEVLSGLGVKPTGWDIDPQDWRLRNAPKIEASVERQLAALHGRAILLLHDVQPATTIALPHILDWLEQENGRRAKDGRAQIKILNYAYLLPERKLIPPLVDALGRVLVTFANLPLGSPLYLVPSGAALAWPPTEV